MAARGEIPARVVVAGVARSGVSTLVAAIRAVSHLPTGSPTVAEWDGDPAAVAILVLDPSSRVDEEESALLARLRRTVGVVALVCTKIDAFWNWPTITRVARATLDPNSELPVFAVSADAALAGAVGESGIDALVDWCDDFVRADPGLRAERVRAAACEVDVSAPVVGGAVEPDVPESDVADLLRRRAAVIAERDRGRSDRLAAVRSDGTRWCVQPSHPPRR